MRVAMSEASELSGLGISAGNINEDHMFTHFVDTALRCLLIAAVLSYETACITGTVNLLESMSAKQDEYLSLYLHTLP